MNISKVEDEIGVKSWKIENKPIDVKIPSGVHADDLGRMFGGIQLDITYSDDSSDNIIWNGGYVEDSKEMKYQPASTRRILKIIMNIMQIPHIQIVWKMEVIYCVSVFQIIV